MDIQRVKRKNKEAGFHFFDDDTMEFFNSRIETPLVANEYFITSEKQRDKKRKYTLKRVNDDWSIDSIDESGEWSTDAFQKFDTLKEASEALDRLIA